MFQRDYIQRLLREFMAALERVLQKKEVESRREQIQQLYEQFLGPYSFYHVASFDDIMKSFAGEDNNERRIAKMEMLAELYYQEASLVSKPIADDLLERAFALYDFLENNSNVYSIQRRMKMSDIKARLS